MPSHYPQQQIPIEALSEYDVREILLDGHEILEKPLTPVEDFQRILNHINFTDSNDEASSSGQKEVCPKSKRVMPAKLWDTMRETMRMTLTEVNALVDILSVIKDEGKYLTINPVASEPPEPNISLFLAGKKRALSTAAEILIKGTDRLRKRHTEILDARKLKTSNSNTSQLESSNFSNSFYNALINFKQEWRLKLHQNYILGDASLRSIGSHFQESGNFEVRESDLFADRKSSFESDKDVEETCVEVVFSRSMEALLDSAVGFGILDVQFHESDLSAGPTALWKYVFEKSPKKSVVRKPHPSKLSQRERLFKAQRLLACREILFHLAWEACGSRGQDSVFKDSIAFATQDELIATLFPGVQICIAMQLRAPECDEDDQLDGEKLQSESNLVQFESETGDANPKECNSLGLQLHRMLAIQHRLAWSNLVSLPRPTCGPVQIPLRLRAAGANALCASCFVPHSNNVFTNSGYSISVAAVAGFAAPAASTWFNTHTNKAHPGSTTGQDRIHSGFFGQDRLALFTEWGNFQASGHVNSSGGRNTDDVVPGATSVAMMEYNLFSRGADDGALQSVVGSSPSIFNQTIAMCRHYYLREKTSCFLSNFAKFSPVKIITHWDVLNSAFQTSARICFYSTDYDAYRYWLGLTINPSGLVIFYSNPPRTYRLGTDFNRLKEILSNQIIHAQLNFVDELATKILGWTCLGNNPFSGLVNPNEIRDGPMIVKIFASPSSKHLVCIHASISFGIRLFIATCDAKSHETNSYLIPDPFGSIGYDQFREVSLNLVRGKHAVAKIESIMTSLT